MNTIKKFELKAITSEVKKLYEGCSMHEVTNIEPRLIRSFDNLAAALDALDELGYSEIYEFKSGKTTMYEVTEYIIEENEYEEAYANDLEENRDDYWISGGDICEFSTFSDEDIEKYNIK